MPGCSHTHTPFDGSSSAFRRSVWLVIFINAGMFIIEMAAGHLSKSLALQADALDFFADAVTYGLSLAVIGMSLRTRARAAMIKAASLMIMGLWVFGSTLHRVFVTQMPEAEVMGAIGFLALLANLASVLLLMRYKDGDANVRSVWLCSRNDAVGNIAVMIAALGVWGSMSHWPDLLVATLMAGLFLSSAFAIFKQAFNEQRPAQAGL